MTLKEAIKKHVARFKGQVDAMRENKLLAACLGTAGYTTSAHEISCPLVLHPYHTEYIDSNSLFHTILV